ncbi:hypothetical protein [Gloeothece verrucosa]|uniref:hypothetical protein n=1 Tax=Gloeothece verrucosa TaxID=2546359 RepID=UPI00017E2024|nr:hypothetical protein [Gloeothece verrucosa]
MVIYQTTKQFYTAIAKALNIPTTNEKDKPLSGEVLKEEITLNANSRTLFIFPESKRLPASVRYWLDSLLNQGVKIVTFMVANPQRDVFLKLQKLELPLVSNQQMRAIIHDQARQMGITLTRSEIAELLASCGRNPFLARKKVAAYALGLEQNLEHTQYIDISPITYSVLLFIGIFRFVGLGTGDRGLYVVGSCILILIMILKQLGKIQGAKRKLGQ